MVGFSVFAWLRSHIYLLHSLVRTSLPQLNNLCHELTIFVPQNPLLDTFFVYSFPQAANNSVWEGNQQERSRIKISGNDIAIIVPPNRPLCAQT